MIIQGLLFGTTSKDINFVNKKNEDEIFVKYDLSILIEGDLYHIPTSEPVYLQCKELFENKPKGSHFVELPMKIKFTKGKFDSAIPEIEHIVVK